MSEMGERWDLRARSDPLAYIETRHEVPDLDSFFALGEHFAQLLVDPALGDVPRGAALDHGCGLGQTTRALAHRFDEVVGVDVSTEMVRRAQELHPEDEFPNVVFHGTDGVRLPLERDSVDFVFSYEVFQHDARARLKHAFGRRDPLTSDATFRGTAPLGRREIEQLWASAGLTIVELRADQTHEPGTRVFVAARPSR